MRVTCSAVRKQTLLSLLALLAVFAVAPCKSQAAENLPSHSASESLKIGLVPYSASSRAIAAWLPLANFLQAELKKPVQVVTAPNHKVFFERVLQGRYFLLLSSPHVAAAMIKRGQVYPVRLVTIPLTARLLVHKNSPFTNLKSLAGKSISTTNVGAFTALLLEQEIALLNKVQPFSMSIRYQSSHAAAIRSLLTGHTDAAYVSRLPHSKSSLEQFKQLKILSYSSITSHPMVVSPTSLGVDHANMIGALLDQYADQEPLSTRSLQPFGGAPKYTFAPIRQSDLDLLEPLFAHWRTQ